MKEILRIAFEERNLNQVYWCVSPDNKRAVRFYDKNGYERVQAEYLGKIEGYTLEQVNTYVWYVAKRKSNA